MTMIDQRGANVALKFISGGLLDCFGKQGFIDLAFENLV